MSAVYPKFREQVWNWLVGVDTLPADLGIYVAVVDESYVYDAAHVDMSDVPAGSVVGPEQGLNNCTFVDGILKADDVQFLDLDDFETFQAVVVYMRNGSESYLMAYLDTSSNGSVPQEIQWPEGYIRWADSGIFRL